MVTEIKPCPFCGSLSNYPGNIDPRPKVMVVLETERWYVSCGYCHTRGMEAATAQGAINWWNTRPIEDKLKEERDKWEKRAYEE